MTDPGLLPRKCTSCETLNRCYYEVCQSCGKELPESSMPKNLDEGLNEEQVKKKELISKIQELEEMKDELGI